jgi:flavorubredoxin
MNEKISLFMSVTADELLFSNDLRENFLNVIGVIYKNEAKEYISQFEQFYDSLNAGIKKLLVKNISENKSVHKIEHLEKAVEEACHHIKLEKLQVKCLQPQAESYSNMASPGMNVNH